MAQDVDVRAAGVAAAGTEPLGIATVAGGGALNGNDVFIYGLAFSLAVFGFVLVRS